MAEPKFFLAMLGVGLVVWAISLALAYKAGYADARRDIRGW